MKKLIAVLVILALLAWLALPLLRVFTLVSSQPSDPTPPADLVLEDVRLAAGTDVAPSAVKEVEIAAWTMHTLHGAPAVVLVHGFKTSRAEMIPWARFLHDGGYNVLLLDTRGCGRSGGSTVGLGATEPQDISLAVAAARGEFGTTRIAVLGISLGVGAAILAAANDPDISAVIADSAWTDQDVLLSRMSSVPLGPVRIPLPPYGVAVANAVIGADVTKARPLDVIASIGPRPILLIHSADDPNPTTTVEGVRKLFAAANEPKELWIASHGGHVGAINAFRDEYHARVIAFLKDALS